MQQTLAFAPTQDDLDEFYFDVPVITLGPRPDPAKAAEDRDEDDSGPVQRAS